MIQAHPAIAFEQLTPTQVLIYDTGHLANTEEGQSINYQFVTTESDSEPVTDEVTLTIMKSLEDSRRDVELNYLTGTRRLPLPAFNGYRGNPVIIATLEYFAKSMGAETGGGTLYFRNRIRDALARKDLKIESGSATYNGKNIETSLVEFDAFTQDKLLAADSIYRNAVITIIFSDEVPAGVLEISLRAKNETQTLSRTLTLE